MLAEDSSSASANRLIFIRATEWASAGILKVFPAEGPSFFSRIEDLPERLADRLAPERSTESVLESDESEALFFGRAAYAAERDALSFLARSEHTRLRLALKLLKKGHPENALERALNRLEEAGYLSDRRFAETWLRSRAHRRTEGRIKLFAGLLSRGVPRETASEALDELFHDTDERVLCVIAMEKLTRLGKTGDTLTSALLRKGFPLSLIRSCMKTVQE